MHSEFGHARHLGEAEPVQAHLRNAGEATIACRRGPAFCILACKPSVGTLHRRQCRRRLERRAKIPLVVEKYAALEQAANRVSDCMREWLSIWRESIVGEPSAVPLLCHRPFEIAHCGALELGLSG